MLEKQLLLFGKEFASEPEEEASCLLHIPTCDFVVMAFSPSEPEEEASCLSDHFPLTCCNFFLPSPACDHTVP